MTAGDDDYRARVARVVATFPPLTSSQIAVLRRAMDGGAGRRLPVASDDEASDA